MLVRAPVLAGALALLAVSSLGVKAAAQPVEASNEAGQAALAIEIGKQGIAAYERGEWETALRLFREADGLYHSPVFVLYAARSLRSLGKLLDAQRLYETLAAESVADDAAPSWKQAHVDGGAELKALKPEIPSVTVTVSRASEEAAASVDGRTISLGQPVRLDPGEHEIVVRDRLRSETQKVTLKAGEHERPVAFDFAPEPPKPPTDAHGKSLERPESDDTVRIFGIVLTAVGALAVGAGAVVGVVALGKSSAAEDDLPASCDADLSCPTFERAGIEDSFSTSQTLAGVADVLLIGGAVVATSGIVLWIVAPDDEAEITASATLGGASIRGRF